jgi:hypothetical protein
MRANGIVIIRLYHDDEAGGVDRPLPYPHARRQALQLDTGAGALSPAAPPWAGIWKRCQMFTANCSEVAGGRMSLGDRPRGRSSRT